MPKLYQDRRSVSGGYSFLFKLLLFILGTLALTVDAAGVYGSGRVRKIEDTSDSDLGITPWDDRSVSKYSRFSSYPIKDTSDLGIIVRPNQRNPKYLRGSDLRPVDMQMVGNPNDKKTFIRDYSISRETIRGYDICLTEKGGSLVIGSIGRTPNKDCLVTEFDDNGNPVDSFKLAGKEGTSIIGSSIKRMGDSSQYVVIGQYSDSKNKDQGVFAVLLKGRRIDWQKRFKIETHDTEVTATLISASNDEFTMLLKDEKSSLVARLKPNDRNPLKLSKKISIPGTKSLYIKSALQTKGSEYILVADAIYNDGSVSPVIIRSSDPNFTYLDYLAISDPEHKISYQLKDVTSMIESGVHMAVGNTSTLDGRKGAFVLKFNNNLKQESVISIGMEGYDIDVVSVAEGIDKTFVVGGDIRKEGKLVGQFSFKIDENLKVVYANQFEKSCSGDEHKGLGKAVGSKDGSYYFLKNCDSGLTIFRTDKNNEIDHCSQWKPSVVKIGHPKVESVSGASESNKYLIILHESDLSPNTVSALNQDSICPDNGPTTTSTPSITVTPYKPTSTPSTTVTPTSTYTHSSSPTGTQFNPSPSEVPTPSKKEDKHLTKTVLIAPAVGVGAAVLVTGCLWRRHCKKNKEEKRNALLEKAQLN